MRPKTGVHWLDDLVEEAGRKGIPALMDREDSRILYSRIVGHDVPSETYRRIDGIPTRNVHGRAKQDPKVKCESAVIHRLRCIFKKLALRCG